MYYIYYNILCYLFYVAEFPLFYRPFLLDIFYCLPGPPKKSVCLFMGN